MLQEAVPKHYIFQCTSPVHNFRQGFPELLDIYNPFQLRVIYGHAVTEEMAKFLHPRALLACPLRDPIARLISQARFHQKSYAAGCGMPIEKAFWEGNQNRTCTMLVRAFPTMAERFDSNYDAAKFILSGFDVVYDVTDFDRASKRIFQRMGLPVPAVVCDNSAKEVKLDLSLPQELLDQYLGDEQALYKDFLKARAAKPDADNPLRDKKAAQAMTNLLQQPVNWQVLSEKYARYLAEDLYISGEYQHAEQWIRRKMAFYSQALKVLEEKNEFAIQGISDVLLPPKEGTPEANAQSVSVLNAMLKERAT